MRSAAVTFEDRGLLRGIALSAEIHHRHHELVRREPWSDAPGVAEALDEEPGGHERNDRQRHFDAEQHVSDAPAPDVRGDAATAEVLDRRAPQHVENRHEAEQDRRDGRDSQRKYQHAGVEVGAEFDHRQGSRRSGGPEDLPRRGPEGETRGSAAQCQDELFGQQLPDQP